MTFVNFSKVPSIFLLMTRSFLKVLLQTFFTIFNLFEHFFNKPINRIFTLMHLHWFIKSIISTYKFVLITTSNLFLVFISTGCINIILDRFLNFFWIRFKACINYTGSLIAIIITLYITTFLGILILNSLLFFKQIFL